MSSATQAVVGEGAGRTPGQFWVTLAAGLPTVLYAVALLATRATDPVEAALCLVLVAVTAAIGWLILARTGDNPVGWLLIADSALMAVGFAPAVWMEYSLDHGGQLHGTALAVYANEALWPTWFAGVTAVAWVFPDGKLPSPRWRTAAWLVVASYVVFIAVGFFGHEQPTNTTVTGYTNPLPELPGVFNWISLVCFLGVIASLVGAVLAVRQRLKRAVGVERMQLLWFAWASLSIPGALTLCIVESTLNGGKVGWVTLVGVVTMATLIPSAIGIALLRYRLFDIEIVLSRTLVYGMLTLMIAGIYIAVVVGIGALIGNRSVAGVIGAGVVAALTQPIYSRLRLTIDRKIYGDRSDPYAALQRLDSRLRETQTPDEALFTVVDSVAESLRLPSATIEFEHGDEVRTLAARGVRGRGELVTRELWNRGELVGSLVVEVPKDRPLAAADDQLLDQLASHIGAAVQSVRLTTELQQSRKGIVTAREEERRRLRRDLHDGVGPSLAAMSLQLDVLKGQVDPEQSEFVERLSGQVHQAIIDIRQLVYELRPPALDQYGLVSALEEHAARMSSGASEFRVRVDEKLPPLSAAAEVVAYRIALEGMTNAARHGGGSLCEVTMAAGVELSITVTDNGVGVDRPLREGVGLRSMRERTEELGGSFSVSTPDRGGTRLCVTLPMES